MESVRVERKISATETLKKSSRGTRNRLQRSWSEKMSRWKYEKWLKSPRYNKIQMYVYTQWTKQITMMTTALAVRERQRKNRVKQMIFFCFFCHRLKLTYVPPFVSPLRDFFRALIQLPPLLQFLGSSVCVFTFFLFRWIYFFLIPHHTNASFSSSVHKKRHQTFFANSFHFVFSAQGIMRND